MSEASGLPGPRTGRNDSRCIHSLSACGKRWTVGLRGAQTRGLEALKAARFPGPSVGPWSLEEQLKPLRDGLKVLSTNTLQLHGVWCVYVCVVCMYVCDVFVHVSTAYTCGVCMCVFACMCGVEGCGIYVCVFV